MQKRTNVHLEGGVPEYVYSFIYSIIGAVNKRAVVYKVMRMSRGHEMPVHLLSPLGVVTTTQTSPDIAQGPWGLRTTEPVTKRRQTPGPGALWVQLPSPTPAVQSAPPSGHHF